MKSCVTFAFISQTNCRLKLINKKWIMNLEIVFIIFMSFLAHFKNIWKFNFGLKLLKKKL